MKCRGYLRHRQWRCMWQLCSKDRHILIFCPYPSHFPLHWHGVTQSPEEY